MRAVRAVARFCYDVVVGDDWRMAVAVALTLVVAYATMRGLSAPDGVVAVVGGATALGAFAAAVLLGVRTEG